MLADSTAARRSAGAVIACVLLAGAGAGCGTGPASTMPPATPHDVTVTLDAGTRYQVMQGFGGSLAFYVNFLVTHPARDRIYQALFADLNLQMLRIANWSGNSGATAMNDTVAAVQAATASLGHPPLIQMSAWSPPAAL